MKRPLTEKQRQWMWFAWLWLCGLMGVLAVSYGIKILMALLGMDK